MEENSNIFKVRPTEAVNDHKGVDLYTTLMSKYHKIDIAKIFNQIYSIFKNSKGNFRYGILKSLRDFAIRLRN